MFLVRNVKEEDISDLLELSKLMVFINLPSDEDTLRKLIRESVKSFKSPSKHPSNNTFIFVLVDLNINKIVGTSMIHGQHGTEDEPHFFLKVDKEEKYSSTINTGFYHGTLKLGIDTNGPTEIGGLILNPEYRNNNEKLGKQLSFARFLFMGLNKKSFKDEIHSELMPPFDKDGNSPLWEAIGRRFLNMDYYEADKLSRSNKEFILSLYPSENIYQTLLPIEARNSIGKVGKQTEPVKKMLETIGFHYNNEVDPFDGGPHYRANLKDIRPIKELFSKTLKIQKLNIDKSQPCLISFKTDDCDFISILSNVEFQGDNIIIDQNIIKEFNLDASDKIFGFQFRI